MGLLRSLRGRALQSSIFARLPDPRWRNALEWDWEQNRVGGATFDEIAFHLSRLASQDSADEQSIALRKGMLSILFGFGAAFAPSARDLGSVAPRGDPSRSRTYNRVLLVKCLNLAGVLRDTGDLKVVLEKALSVLLPGHVAHMIRDTFLAHLQVPSPSVLSRFRIILDCGYTVWMRQLNTSLHRRDKQVVRSIWSDSSPQGLENWQITESCTVADCVRTGQIVDELALMAGAVMLDEGSPDVDTDDAEAKAEARAQRKQRYSDLTKELAQGVDHHILLPTGLGFRRSDYIHKLKALVHSIHNESADYQERHPLSVCRQVPSLGTRLVIQPVVVRGVAALW